MSWKPIEPGQELALRERQCLDGLVKLGSDKLIARSLGISHRTVEVYLRRAMVKSGQHDRVLVAVWWDRQNRVAA